MNQIPSVPVNGVEGHRAFGCRGCVLVVDDLADAADSLVWLIRDWGFDAQASYRGSAALAAAELSAPDVVLLDIAMPAMDGFELARRLRENPRCESAVFIALTGYSPDTCGGRAAEAGFDYYLLKPVDPDELQGLLIEVTNPGRRGARPFAGRRHAPAPLVAGG
jgi:CheY-like chemotaxis protein